MPPTYRDRLRIEGVTLAGCGVIASLLLLASTPSAHANLLSTAVQLLVVTALIAWLGPRAVHRALAAAEPLFTPELGSGEPTPLWHLALIVVGLAALAGELAAWDVALRVTLGCVLVGLAQAFLLERIVAVNEGASRRRYLRVAGSRILRETKLGYTLRGLAGSAVIDEPDAGEDARDESVIEPAPVEGGADQEASEAGDGARASGAEEPDVGSSGGTEAEVTDGMPSPQPS